MDLNNLKEVINKAGFSEESLSVMNQVLDEAIGKGVLEAEAKEKLLGIVDAEMELADIEADALEEIALALETFANEVDSSNAIEEKDLQSAEEALDFDTKKVQDAVTSE